MKQDPEAATFLYDDEIEELYLYLIKEDDVGELYEVSCGGLGCRHHFVRGRKIILFGPFWWVLRDTLLGCCSHHVYCTEITHQEAERFDHVLAFAQMRIDRDPRYQYNSSASYDMLENPSCEAFLHVILQDETKAVLLWENYS